MDRRNKDKKKMVKIRYFWEVLGLKETPYKEELYPKSHSKLTQDWKLICFAKKGHS